MAMEEKLATLRKQEVGALRHAMFSWSFWLEAEVMEMASGDGCSIGWKAVKGHKQKKISAGGSNPMVQIQSNPMFRMISCETW